jgi:hypothetical protein
LARKQEADRKLLEGFEESLTSLLGPNEAKAVIKLGDISEGSFDAKAIDSSLEKVFGASMEGLSIIQGKVIEGMSENLGIVPSPPSIEHGEGVGFASSLEAIADRYRIKEKAAFGTVGLIAGVISSICCLGPIAFALLGFASLSSSLALAMDLTSAYKPVELAASVGFLGVTVVFQLRRKNQCSLSGLRRNLAYIVIPTTVLLVTYAVVNYWLGATFFGGPGSLFH